MKITGFDVLTLEIPMRMSVQHALAERKTARNVLVVARDGEGRAGWGESCPRPYVTGETVEGAQKDLAEHILPRLLGREFGDLNGAASALTEILDGLRRDQHAAFCAGELAVLDLVGKTFGVSAVSFARAVALSGSEHALHAKGDEIAGDAGSGVPPAMDSRASRASLGCGPTSRATLRLV